MISFNPTRPQFGGTTAFGSTQQSPADAEAQQAAYVAESAIHPSGTALKFVDDRRAKKAIERVARTLANELDPGTDPQGKNFTLLQVSEVDGLTQATVETAQGNVYTVSLNPSDVTGLQIRSIDPDSPIVLNTAARAGGFYAVTAGTFYPHPHTTARGPSVNLVLLAARLETIVREAINTTSTTQ